MAIWILALTTITSLENLLPCVIRRRHPKIFSRARLLSKGWIKKNTTDGQAKA